MTLSGLPSALPALPSTLPVTFLWPFMLVTLLAIPILVVLYVRIQRRRAFATSLFRASAPNAGRAGSRAEANGRPGGARQGPGFRRHVPFVLFVLGLAVVLVALARPQAQLALPRVEGTVMLVFDVSGSMGATDVQPSRLEAAKKAAREFVQTQPSTVKIGIVSFSGAGIMAQTPTNDTASLLATINRLQPTKGTSLGSGIASALNAIAVDAGLTGGQSTPGEAAPGAPARGPAAAPQVPGQSGQQPGAADASILAQLPAGNYPSSEIVILSDGEDNQGVDPVQAAQVAAQHGVKVDTLGFGTTAGATITTVDGYRVHTALDEATLQQIAQAAGGTYYPPQSETNPQQVYSGLTPHVVVKPEYMEVTAVFAGASILLLFVGSLLSTLWFRRLV